jgi:hypothetical protein
MPSLPALLRTMLFPSLTASFVLYLVSGLASVTFPYDLNYGEAPVLDQARRAIEGQAQYKPDLGAPPS